MTFPLTVVDNNTMIWNNIYFGILKNFATMFEIIILMKLIWSSYQFGNQMHYKLTYAKLIFILKTRSLVLICQADHELIHQPTVSFCTSAPPYPVHMFQRSRLAVRETDPTASTQMKLLQTCCHSTREYFFFFYIFRAEDPVACQWTGLNMHDKWWCVNGGR